MQRKVGLLLFTTLVVVLPFIVYGQEGTCIDKQSCESENADCSDRVKVRFGCCRTASNISGSQPQARKKSSVDAIDLPSWIAKEGALDGLQSADLLPWHIVVGYDQYDEDGDNVHSGVYEEFWAGEKKYKRIYRSDNLNQTDFGTDKGLFRQGDQQWPDRAQSQVRSEVISPFYYAATPQGFHGRKVERTFSNYML